jgi:glutamate dehydrogenase/leucine dehydrogenase
LNEKGCKIIALSDVSGGLLNADGLPVRDILAFVANGGRLCDFRAAGTQNVVTVRC